MEHSIRIALLGFLVLGALFLVPTSAQAAENGTINFTGTATVGSPGLTYPPPGTTSPSSGPTLPFSFASSTCDGASEGKKGPQADTSCSITATGTVTGFCGLSNGTANGTITFAGQSISFSVSWTSPPSGGGTLILMGSADKGGQTGTVKGEVTAVPTGGSCLAGGATGFTIAGTVVYMVA